MSKKKETLLIQPIRGKFVQSNINGKIVRVWLVDPDTNRQGTEIPYNDAIAVLALPHPVVCMAQVKGKDGKYCNVLDEDDLELLEQKKNEYLYGDTGTVSDSADSGNLAKLVETQAELIKSQAKQLDMMQAEFQKAQKSMNKLIEKMKKNQKIKELDLN